MNDAARTRVQEFVVDGGTVVRHERCRLVWWCARDRDGEWLREPSDDGMPGLRLSFDTRYQASKAIAEAARV